jgi:hypothetical protein
MLRKLSVALALIGALGLAFVAAPTDAYAKKKKVVVVKGPRSVYVVGKSYNGYLYVGKKRRHWHDRWYAYGEGPCWIRVGDVWFWNVAVCP